MDHDHDADGAAGDARDDGGAAAARAAGGGKEGAAEEAREDREAAATAPRFAVAHTLIGHHGAVSRARFSPDGRFIASVCA